ncbi:MAG TPA: hypothetical protein VIH18_20330 [Candidatus Binatia bacterium]|jgi:hypothetical protein
MTGNTGRGRPLGSRNKLTAETLALVTDGRTPVAFALGLMNDESKPQDLRLNAARIAAPYLHSKPQLEPRMVSFALPENFISATPEALNKLHADILRAVANSEISLEDAKDISSIIETQRRTIETADLAERIKRLEKS